MGLYMCFDDFDDIYYNLLRTKLELWNLMNGFLAPRIEQ